MDLKVDESIIPDFVQIVHTTQKKILNGLSKMKHRQKVRIRNE